MFITFVVDTSGSMSQRSINGMTLLDCCKVAIEHFIKIRSKDASMRNDKFFLVSSEEGFSVVNPGMSSVVSPPPAAMSQSGLIGQNMPGSPATSTGSPSTSTTTAATSTPCCIKAGWKDNFNTFLSEVKNLAAKDMSNLSFSTSKAFDLLNQYRITYSVDNYGIGRLPWYIDPGIIILLTDGSSLSNYNNIMDTFVLQKTAGNNDLSMEPYRWDQRLFSLILRFGSVTTSPNLPPSVDPQQSNVSSSIGQACDNTGGKCQVVTNIKSLFQNIELIVSKLHHGVIVNFEPLMNTAPSAISQQQQQQSPQATGLPVPMSMQSIAVSSLHKMLFVSGKGTTYNWPIPESYYPDLSSATLPLRSAHPMIKYSLQECDGYIPEGFPFDRYEVEPCNMTQTLISLKIKCVSVYIQNSQQISGQGETFGFLRCGAGGNTGNIGAVYLYVLPYNYPKLWPLIDEFVQQLKMIPSQKWKMEFENYCQSIPPYYMNPLRNVFKKYYSIPTASSPAGYYSIPESIDIQFQNYIGNIIKKLKQNQPVSQPQQPQQPLSKTAKLLPTMNKSQQQQPQQQPQQQQISNTNITSVGFSMDSGYRSFNSKGINRNYHQILGGGSSFDVDMSEAIDESNSMDVDSSGGANSSSNLNITAFTNILNRNVFDTPRSNLLIQLDRMRDHLIKRKLDDDEAKHHLPISQMGNFQETIAKREVLRDIDDEKKPNLPLFGNPFRKEKGSRLLPMSIDEADISELQNSPQGGFIDERSIQKRKRILTTKQLQQQHKEQQAQHKEQQPPISDSAVESMSNINFTMDETTKSTNSIQLPPSSPPLNYVKIPSSPPSTSNILANTTTTSTTNQINNYLSSQNIELRQFVNREIRKPTKHNNDIILDKLQNMNTDVISKQIILSDALRLSKEYKKSSLVLSIESILESLTNQIKT